MLIIIAALAVLAIAEGIVLVLIALDRHAERG